jgi:hypothetical protein
MFKMRTLHNSKNMYASNFPVGGWLSGYNFCIIYFLVEEKIPLETRTVNLA